MIRLFHKQRFTKFIKFLATQQHRNLNDVLQESKGGLTLGHLYRARTHLTPTVQLV